MHVEVKVTAYHIMLYISSLVRVSSLFITSSIFHKQVLDLLRTFPRPWGQEWVRQVYASPSFS